MVQPYWKLVNLKTLLILLICFNFGNARKRSKLICPIGFRQAFSGSSDDPICYRRKGPENFSDKFLNCPGNLYTAELYHSLNFTETNVALWSDYKSLYPGGPFIDMSYTESTGDMLDEMYDPNLGMDEELCIVIDPERNFTATRCNEQHYRYCFLKPYVKEDDMKRDDCKDVPGYWRFWSPIPTCLAPVTGAGGGAVRANWRQAKELCAKRNGFLLSKGWRYANNPMLYSGSDPIFPLGIVMDTETQVLKRDTLVDSEEIPESDWHFANQNITKDAPYGALRNDNWELVNNSFVFLNVICERSLDLESVSLNVSVDLDNKLTLTTSKPIDTSDIHCFTDSLYYYPKKLKIKQDGDSNVYILHPYLDGYYWCMHVDSNNYIVSESNKVLFIREQQSLINDYAIKFKVKHNYIKKKDDQSKIAKLWQKKLAEYIFYRHMYVSTFGELELDDPVSSLKEFKASHPKLKYRDTDIITRIITKRVYLDEKTVLVHVTLNPKISLVPPGVWDDLEVEYMKPVYFCKESDSAEITPLGTSLTMNSRCRKDTCVGDFNEGVQLVSTAIEGCTTPHPMTMSNVLRVNTEIYYNMPTATVVTPTDSSMVYVDDSSSEEKTDRPPPPPIHTTPSTPELTTMTETVSTVNSITEEVTTVSPTTEEPPTTTMPLPPEDQLLQVLEDLGTLLQNDTNVVTVADVENTFDQVDSILEAEDDLDIPGQLLHLLDKLGSRVYLNGSKVAMSVRSNIAMLMADANVDTPVRGLRIAARDEEIFTPNAFEIISEEINASQLLSAESEAVVYLPPSISNSSRRISFVVFRNDRAFQPNYVRLAVNSRVLSINVENLTQFDDGEYIDIHLSPIMESPDRNMSRTCAYWHFLDDGSGYWSQDGCTLIKSTEQGVLDTCRCDHLTHFAEILIPRTTFTELNETALEILSIIGCCLSIFGLALIGLTAALFRSWRRDYSNKVWLQLCVAIFLLITCFLIIVFAQFDTYNIPCMLVGVALHYAVLASFCWMFVAAVLSYRRLVIVFTRDASHKLLKASAFAWGAPCAIIGVLLSISPHSYAGQFDEKTPSGAFCYPSGLALYIAVYAPIAFLLLANWILFGLIVRSVFASRRIQRHGDTNEALRCASVSCLLVFLFGLPWIFGLFASNVVAAYFFTLTATFQGFVLFIFFVVGNKKTRDLWLNKLKIKQTRKVPVTSSTYTHRSTGVRIRDPVGASTIEANSSKPRSLASPDNSRFS